MASANNEINSSRWQKLRLKILIRDSYTCAYCGDTANQVDHIVPRSAGGTNDPENLTAACARCNRAKGAGQSMPIFSADSRPPTRPLYSLSPMVRFDPPMQGNLPK